MALFVLLREFRVNRIQHPLQALVFTDKALVGLKIRGMALRKRQAKRRLPVLDHMDQRTNHFCFFRWLKPPVGLAGALLPPLGCMLVPSSFAPCAMRLCMGTRMLCCS